MWLYRLWALSHPSPTDLSARSRVRPEKSKKLRYSPATSLLNSLLPGEQGLSIRSRAQQTAGVRGSGPLGTLTHPPRPARSSAVSLASQLGSDSSTLGQEVGESGKLPRGGDVSSNTFRKGRATHVKGVGGEMMQSVRSRGNCPRSYQQGHVAGAGEQEWGQQEMRQGTGPEGRGKDWDLIWKSLKQGRGE